MDKNTDINPAFMAKLKKDLSESTILGTKEFKKQIKIAQEQEEDQQKSEEKDVFLKGRALKIAISVFFVIIISVVVYFYRINKWIAEDLEKTIKDQETNFMAKIEEEKTQIKKGLTEKYRADMVSYEALSRRLKIEQEANKKLKEK